MSFDLMFVSRELRSSLHTPFEIEFFNDRQYKRYPWRDDRDYLVAVDSSLNVVGVVCFKRDSDIATGIAKRPCLSIGYVAVASFHKNKGIAKSLVNKIFELARQTKRSVRLTEYEAEGAMYLQRIIRREASDHPYSVFEFSTEIHS